MLSREAPHTVSPCLIAPPRQTLPASVDG